MISPTNPAQRSKPSPRKEGDPVYISATAGHLTTTAPSSNGETVRTVGYSIDVNSSDALIYFWPDNIYNDADVSATSQGGGFDAAQIQSSVSEVNGEIETTLRVDIGGGSIVSSGDADDVIGEDGVAAAYITRITTALNGIVYRGEMACLEVPTTGDANINLCADSDGTIAEDAGSMDHILVDGTIFNNYYKKYPLLSIGTDIYRMVPLVEFMERLIINVGSTVRNCDNKIEDDRYNEIEQIIKSNIIEKQNIEPTYWK